MKSELLFQKCACSAYMKKVSDGVAIYHETEQFDPVTLRRVKCDGRYMCVPAEGEPFESPCEGANDLEKTYYKRVEKKFFGVCVGFKKLTAEAYLGVDTEYQCDGSEYNLIFKTPKTVVDCAIVYYASGRKRFVPMDAIERSGENEEIEACRT